MTTLHLEVTVNDVEAFTAGFATHTPTRLQMGVRAERVRHLVGDPTHILVDLDFDAPEPAEAFLTFLRDVIWKESPAMVGTPSGRILEDLELRATPA